MIFLLSALVWLLTARFALISSFKMHSPEFLGNYEWLTFGRARSAHLNAVIYGWSANASFAVALWLMARLSARRCATPACSSSPPVSGISA